MIDQTPPIRVKHEKVNSFERLYLENNIALGVLCLPTTA
jgi:hypothetical protein